jgi:hypothetical protein
MRSYFPPMLDIAVQLRQKWERLGRCATYFFWRDQVTRFPLQARRAFCTQTHKSAGHTLRTF